MDISKMFRGIRLHIATHGRPPKTIHRKSKVPEDVLGYARMASGPDSRHVRRDFGYGSQTTTSSRKNTPQTHPPRERALMVDGRCRWYADSLARPRRVDLLGIYS